MFIVVLSQPGEEAVTVTGEPGAVGEIPETGRDTKVTPARTLMEPGTVSFEVSELEKLTVTPPSGTGSEKITVKLRCSLAPTRRGKPEKDRKSTRLNSSHVATSSAAFC